MAKKKTPKNKTKKLSNGVSEEDFLKVLDNIANRLSHKFRFAYHDIEDMKQQAAIFAIEGLERYDNSRPLENFLWTHVRNRLFNYKRNNYQRPDKPCLTCPLYDKAYKCSLNQCSKYTDKNNCDLYKAWSKRNDTKKNIMQPSYIEEDTHPTPDKDLSSFIQNKELIQFLDQNIQTEYREIYLKLKHGTKIPKQQLEKLKIHIFNLMEKNSWKMENFLENEDS
jgi:DNA-directed RNA polymerase specialized sigma24 family protein